MKIKIKEEAVFKEDENGHLVVVNILKEDNLYYKIHGVAREAWNAFQKGDELDSVVKNIAARYKVDEEQVAKDINKFLDDLRNYDLVDSESEEG